MEETKKVGTEETEKDVPVLCGFVWCHGKRDFSLYEVSMSREDRDAIETILRKYECDGTSVRNAWEERLCDVMVEDYD